MAEVVCTLQKFGEVWFPKQADYYEGGQRAYSVEVTRAEFNAPDAPRRFTPVDLGIEPGSIVSWVNRPSPGPVMVWDGETVLPDVDAFHALVRAGKRQWGPTFQKLQRGETIIDPYQTEENRRRMEVTNRKFHAEHVFNRHLSLWESYVRNFIQRYELREEQAEQALKILKRCQDGAESATRHARTECLPLLTEFLASGQPLEDKKQKRLNELIEQIVEKVDRIFNEDLKPKLEPIPTRAQREAAERRAATQPQSAPSK